MRSKSSWTLVTLVLSSAFALNSCTTSVPRTSSSNAIWVATQDDDMVKAYSINRSNGSISPIGNNGRPVATGAQPSAIAVSRDGTTLFIANAGDNSISVYLINSDGSLTVSGAAVPVGTAPKAMALDPTSALLFVANYGSDTIMVFTTTLGSVTLKSSFAIQTPVPSGGNGPVALAVTPNTFPCTDNRTATPVTRNCYAIYAANQISGTVTAYDYFVDGSGNFVRGAIDLNGNFILGGTVTGSPYSAGMSPSGLAFSRCAGASSTTQGAACTLADGNNLFVANAGSNDVSIFSACIELTTCQSGELSPDGTLIKLGSSVAAGGGPATVLVDPASDFVYVVDRASNQISEYQYSPVTGGLTSLGATTPSSTPLVAGAITTNIGSNTSSWVVVTTTATLDAFAIGSNGTLNPSTGQVTIPGQPSAVGIR